MDERTLRVLEYPAIRELVAGQAGNPLGQELAAHMRPADNLAEVRLRQQQTTEARSLLDRAGAPLAGVRDIRDHLRVVSIGGELIAQDLLEVAATLSASRRLRTLLTQPTLSAPELQVVARPLVAFRELEDAIGKCIDERSQIKDTASDKLREIRRKTRELHENLTRRLERMVHSTTYQKMLSEPVVTVRRGRFCLPVRSEFRGEFHGILHDTSSSGATFFMEPLAIVEQGNEMESLRHREEEEIQRILNQLSAGVGEKAAEIIAALKALGELDLIFARASLAETQKAIEPELNDSGALELYAARHPLLQCAVVPIDVRLGEDFVTLIITGPNTGGKTVTLKTVGLLALMAQSGLHLPVGSGSKIAVFPRIFADIGDEQSLQQNLSTFSSHMSQIVRVMQEADAHSLVLLDEIGAGTDPAEGSALAKAVLEELYRRGCRTVVTTHYGELKAFAYTQPGVENASVEFDPVTFKPTYHLRIGLPGSSNAFAIAANLGLGKEIIKSAKGQMGEGRVELDFALERVEEDQRTLAEEKRAASEDRLALQKSRQEYEALTRDLKHRREEILNAARAQARETLLKAKKQGENLLALLRQSGAELKAKEKARREASEAESLAALELSSLEEEARLLQPTRPPVAPASLGQPLPEVKRGQPVFVRSVRQRGEVLNPADENGQVEVQIGILRLSVPLAELEAAAEAPVRNNFIFVSTPKNVPSEIHLRGMRVEEALEVLEHYLDEAIAAGLREVRVVHGKGTGAVRLAAQELLRKHPGVASLRAALPAEGGGGVTYAILKAG
jgi:DNA mismatch repair protein MutS2